VASTTVLLLPEFLPDSLRMTRWSLRSTTFSRPFVTTSAEVTSAWPDVAPGTSTRPLRPLQVPASCQRGYSSELTLRTVEVSIAHVEEMGTSVVGELSQELTTREARTGAAIWRRHDELQTAAGPPRDTFHRSVSPSARNRLLLQLCSSGGGTRTHNLRINSPPLCQLSYPGMRRGSLPTASDWTRLRSCGSGPDS
jgi:hypothetical protein